MKTKLIKTEVNYLLKDEQLNVIISTTSLKKEGLALSLKNCQAIELGYDLDELDLDKLACDWHKNEYGFIPPLQVIKAYIAGFQKALSILGDKKYSELDLYRAFTTNSAGNEDTIRDRFYNVLLPSLQQTEWDVVVEMEKVKDETKIIGSVKGVKGSGDKITTYKSIPKLDADGCLILKRI